MPRKPKRQAAARSPRRRRNKHGGCLIFVILFVIIGLGMFLAAHKKNNPDLTWPDVVEEALPETVRETVKEVLPQTVKEEIEKVRKKERKEIEKEKIEKIEKEEKPGPIRDHPVEEKKTVPPAFPASITIRVPRQPPMAQPFAQLFLSLGKMAFSLLTAGPIPLRWQKEKREILASQPDKTRSFSITAVISVPLRKRLRRLSSWQTVMAVSLSSVMLGPIRQKPGNGHTRLLYNRALLWSLPRPCYSKEVI